MAEVIVRFWVEVSLLVLTLAVISLISDDLKSCSYPHVVVPYLRTMGMPKLESSWVCRREAVDQFL